MKDLPAGGSLFVKYSFSIILGLALLFLLIIQNINGNFRMHDFEVYYTAAKSFLNGNPVYGKAFGLSSGFFKYAPITLILFIPFALLPFMIAKVIYFLLVAFLTLLTYQYCSNIIARQFYPGREKQAGAILFIVLAITGAHLFREMDLGNINMLLLFLFVLALLRFEHGKDIQAGLLMGAGALIKPHFLLLLPLLVLRKKIKASVAFVALLVVGFCMPVLFAGVNKGMALNASWIEAVKEHNQSLLGYPDTVYSLIYHGFVRNIFPNAGQGFALNILVLIGIGFSFLVLRNMRREQRREKNDHNTFVISPGFCFEYFFLIACIPNLMATDTEHFLLSIPVVLYIVRYLVEHKKHVWVAIFMLCTFLSYSDFGNDVFGKTLSDWLELHGFTGLGNLLILGSALILFLFFSGPEDQEEGLKRAKT